MKKVWPWLTTLGICVIAAVMLLVILPSIPDTKAQPNDNKQVIEDNRGTIDTDLGLDDRPTEETNPAPELQPVSPVLPDEPTTPTEPTDPEPNEPEPTPVFTLTIENLRGTIWYDANRQWRLTFNAKKNNYQIVRLAITNGTVTDETIIDQGTWKLSATTVNLTTAGETGSPLPLTYLNQTLNQTAYDYCFALTNVD